MPLKPPCANPLLMKISGIFIVWVVLLGVIYLSIASGLFQHFFHLVNQQLHGNIAAQVVNITRPLRTPCCSDLSGVRNVIQSAMKLNPSAEIYLLDKDGYIVENMMPKLPTGIKQIDLGPVSRYIAEKGCNYTCGINPRRPEEDCVFSAAPIHENGTLSGYVYVVLASETLHTVLSGRNRSIFLQLGAAILFMTLLTSIGVSVLAGKIINCSLQRAATVVQRFKDGEYTARVPAHGSGNLGVLTSTFNNMADTIVSNMEAIAATDRMRRELIANISHDLRSPLAVMQGYLEILKDQHHKLSHQEQQQFLTIVNDGAQNLNSLVSGLFEYSKLESGYQGAMLEPMSINDLVSDIIIKYQLSARKNGVNLNMETPFELPLVLADAALMERIFQNLLDNALKFTGSGGSIIIQLALKGNFIDIAVIDSGRGIPYDQQQLVFERFQKSRTRSGDSGGSGLGLAIVKKILELHHSDISLQSTPGKGSVFRFRLPVCTI